MALVNRERTIRVREGWRGPREQMPQVGKTRMVEKGLNPAKCRTIVYQ